MVGLLVALGWTAGAMGAGATEPDNGPDLGNSPNGGNNHSPDPDPNNNVSPDPDPDPHL